MTKLPVFSVEGQVKQQSVPPSLDPPQSEGTNPNRGSNLNIGCIDLRPAARVAKGANTQAYHHLEMNFASLSTIRPKYII